jgi:hypothetical protein
VHEENLMDLLGGEVASCGFRAPLLGTALSSVPAMQSSDHFPLFDPFPRFWPPIQLASVGQATLCVDAAKRQPFKMKSGHFIGNCFWFRRICRRGPGTVVIIDPSQRYCVIYMFNKERLVVPVLCAVDIIYLLCILCAFVY